MNYRRNTWNASNNTTTKIALREKNDQDQENDRRRRGKTEIEIEEVRMIRIMKRNIVGHQEVQQEAGGNVDIHEIPGSSSYLIYAFIFIRKKE